MTSPTGEVQLSQRFTPFGEVKDKYGDGEAAFGYTLISAGRTEIRRSNRLAVPVSTGTAGQFISRDTLS